jgi:hypothetical protein
MMPERPSAFSSTIIVFTAAVGSLVPEVRTAFRQRLRHDLAQTTEKHSQPEAVSIVSNRSLYVRLTIHAIVWRLLRWLNEAAK